MEDVFRLLELATELEPGNRIEAATKYYEAVYLMRRYRDRLPAVPSEKPTRDLLQEKIEHYERLAGRLMAHAHQDPSQHSLPPPDDNDDERQPKNDRHDHHHDLKKTPSASSNRDRPPLTVTTSQPPPLQTSWSSASYSATSTLTPSTVFDPRSPVDDADMLSNASRAERASTAVLDENDGAVALAVAVPIPSPASATRPMNHHTSSNIKSHHDEDDSGDGDNDAASNRIHTTATQANAQLAKALDQDEKGQTEKAVSAYMSAAQLYLQALQAAEQRAREAGMGPGHPSGNGRSSGSSPGGSQHHHHHHHHWQSIALVLRRRVENVLDRLEQIKQGNGDRTRSGARSVPTKTIVEQKKTRQQQPQTPGRARPETDTRATKLTSEEIEILKISSLMTSGLFLPWSDLDAQELLHQVQRQGSTPTALFTDPDGYLPLSSKQKARFYKWARPSEIVKIRQGSLLSQRWPSLQPSKPLMIHSFITPYTIKQQYITDCSFVASLCICAAFERRFRKTIITSILHPQTAEGDLLYNPAGKYLVKLWLNGVARCVVIDDYLPIDKHGNLLCSHTTPVSGGSIVLELWVCLIEKAYMKLCGGYDFPGSNSGVDLFSLTGWIPERILFAQDPSNVRDFETHPERAWSRLYSASSYGDCLITVSTQSDLDAKQAEALGLVTGHAYAVLAVLETQNKTRLLQLKNPWAHQGWKGRFSSHDRESWRDPAFCAEVGYDPALAQQQDDGVFFISWQDILRFFQNIHLSWNPFLFQHRTTTHGFWPLSQGPLDDTFNVGENPQYVLTLSDRAIEQQATLWVLISRHVTKHEQLGNEANDYLTIHVHRNTQKKERIYYPGKSGNCVLTGAYTNNPHVLVRYDVTSPDDRYLSLVLSQYNKSHDLGYTLSCYCTEDFTLGRPVAELRHQQELSSAWTPHTAGGPMGRPSYRTNPQFALSVPASSGQQPVRIQIKLSTPKTVAGHVLLVPVTRYGQGLDYAAGEPLLDSGKYRHGWVVTDRVAVPAGPYLVVISSFHPGESASFRVVVSSSEPVLLKAITV